jgi:hypothetical protein
VERIINEKHETRVNSGEECSQQQHATATRNSNTQQQHATATPNSNTQHSSHNFIHFCLTLGIGLQSTFFDGTRTRTTA